MCKERLYRKKCRERLCNECLQRLCKNCENWSKLWKLVKIVILLKIVRLVKIVKFGWNCKIWSRLWNLYEIVKFSWHQLDNRYHVIRAKAERCYGYLRVGNKKKVCLLRRSGIIQDRHCDKYHVWVKENLKCAPGKGERLIKMDGWLWGWGGWRGLLVEILAETQVYPHLFLQLYIKCLGLWVNENITII